MTLTIMLTTAATVMLTMAGRRSAAVLVVVVVARVAVNLLPSCDLSFTSGMKSAYPSVGIAPRRFLPGSVGVPLRMQPPAGHNPPYPTLSVGGIGLMEGTPGIVLLVMVLLGMVVRLVTSELLLHVSSNARLPSSFPMLVMVVIVLNVSGAIIGVTTRRRRLAGRQGRRSGGFKVRRRRPAPGFTFAGGLVMVSVNVTVRSVAMMVTAMVGLVGAVASSVGQGSPAAV